MSEPIVDQERLAETLLWLCAVPSPIGEEKALCDAVVTRLARVPLAAPVRRYGDSIVVPVTRGTGGPRIALAGHLDVVRTAHDGPPRRASGKYLGLRRRAGRAPAGQTGHHGYLFSTASRTRCVS